jgi:hypothetical protein
MDPVHAIPRAVYVADGGELPAMERHYLLYQVKYRKMAGAALRALSTARIRALAENPVRRTDVALADVAELESLAEQIEGSWE